MLNISDESRDEIRAIVFSHVTATPKRHRKGALGDIDDTFLPMADRIRFDTKASLATIMINMVVDVLTASALPKKTRLAMIKNFTTSAKLAARAWSKMKRDEVADLVLEVAAWYHDATADLGAA